MTARTRRGIWLAGLVAAVAIATAVYWRWPGGPSVPPPAPETAGTVAIAETPFTEWMRFEQASQHRELLERYYVDVMLGHQVFTLLPAGLPPHQGRALFLDDDDLLLSSGRRLFNREALPQPGFVGKFCYVHSNFCTKRLFEVSFVIDGQPAVIYDNLYRIERYPSRTVTRYALDGVQIDEHKYITYDDRAVCSYEVRSTDGRWHEVSLQAVAHHLPMPRSAGPAAYPLLGRGVYDRQPVFVYLDAPGFRSDGGYPVRLTRALAASGDGAAVRADVAVSFEDAERTATASPLPADVLERHVADFQRWFADNVPYFDAPDGLTKRMWYYRWWVVRFNLTEPDTSDLTGRAFYEGKLGFDNVISFAVPAQLEELSYLRDPRFALEQAQNSYRNLSSIGAVVDPPGSPYWGEMYSQWIAGALADVHRVHPIDPGTLRELLPAMGSDVRAWMRAFDPDGDFLPSRNVPRITGYDLDVLSWWYFNGLKLDLFAKPPDLERVDFASFVYANARGVAELAVSAGQPAVAEEFSALAERIRAAVLAKLWDPGTAFFYPQTAGDDTRIPVRELHGFFPFTMRLAPDSPPYTEALRKFVDPAEFWARYPPVITSAAHYRTWSWEMDGLTRNIAPHPISMGALTALRALHDYHQDIVTPGHFMDLMRRYTSLMYPGVHPNDPGWRPNAHEYYSQWEPGSRSPLPKPSDISHDFHSMYCALVVQGMVGLRPRTDETIELRPAALEWPYFALHRLRYHGRDLTIVWDRPDGQVRYPGYPEGFSLYIDDALAFTRPALTAVLYDMGTGAVEEGAAG